MKIEILDFIKALGLEIKIFNNIPPFSYEWTARIINTRVLSKDMPAIGSHISKDDAIGDLAKLISCEEVEYCQASAASAICFGVPRLQHTVE